MQKAVGSGDTAVLPAMALTFSWSLATHLQPHSPHGVVARRLFVSRLGRSLTAFGRHLIGSRSMAATPTWVVAAPHLSMFSARLLRSWSLHWAKIPMLICSIETAWAELVLQ